MNFKQKVSFINLFVNIFRNFAKNNSNLRKIFYYGKREKL